MAFKFDAHSFLNVIRPDDEIRLSFIQLQALIACAHGTDKRRGQKQNYMNHCASARQEWVRDMQRGFRAERNAMLALKIILVASPLAYFIIRSIV
jgi:hypothetical protein